MRQAASHTGSAAIAFFQKCPPSLVNPCRPRPGRYRAMTSTLDPIPYSLPAALINERVPWPYLPRKSRCSLTAPISTRPQDAGFRHRLQAVAARVPIAWLPVAGLLLYRGDRGPGVLLDRPLIDWLDYNGYTVVTRRRRNSSTSPAAQGQRQHGHRACGQRDGNSRRMSIISCCSPATAIFRSLVEAIQRKACA